ncbi:MAG: CHAD domain-containing protein [Solirubrobacteraceae bacterium]
MGVGLALVRAGSEQRNSRRRREERRRGVLAGEPLAEGLRRMALAQADLALRELDALGANGAGPDRGAGAVHEARKAIKRLRTAVRLLEEELGSSRCAREDDALKRAGRGLSGSRDAEVMLATLDGLSKRHPRRLGSSGGVAAMRRRLAGEREAAQRRMMEDPSALADVTAELRAFRARAAAWPLEARPGLMVAEPGLRTIYRQGRRRRRRAARAPASRRTRAMHRWRKRVKDLRYAAEMLEHGEPRDGALAKLAKRAEVLGETLGEDHDLAVLGEWVRASGKRAGASRGARRRVLKAIARRRRKLRRRALEQGKRLYRRPSDRFLARVRRAYWSEERRRREERRVS